MLMCAYLSHVFTGIIIYSVGWAKKQNYQTKVRMKRMTLIVKFKYNNINMYNIANDKSNWFTALECSTLNSRKCDWNVTDLSNFYGMINGYTICQVIRPSFETINRLNSIKFGNCNNLNQWRTQLNQLQLPLKIIADTITPILTYMCNNRANVCLTHIKWIVC